MNRDLQKQQEEFRKVLQRQPTLPRHVAAPAAYGPRSGATEVSLATILGERPLNAYVHSIIMFLKQTGRPATVQEIRDSLGIDLNAHRDFLSQVCQSDRIELDPSTRTLRYNPPFGVRCKDDIIPALKRQPNFEGIDLFELKDTFPRVEDACEELQAAGEVIILRMRADGPRVMFLNDFKVRFKVDDDLRQLWASISLPSDPAELRIQMTQHGLKPVSFTESTLAATSGIRASQNGVSMEKRPVRRPNRRIKITNNYLEGVDLSRDPPAA